MRAYLLPMFVVWPFLYDHWNGHFAWNVNYLLNDYQDRAAINTAELLRFFLSPEMFVTVAVFLIAALLGGDFLRHQIRRAFAATNNARSLFWAALAVACLGVREPYLLASAFIVMVSGFLVLLFDAAGTL
jgi:hypothetical protein